MKKANKPIAPAPRMKTLIKAEIRENNIQWVTAQRVTEITEWHWSDLVSYREEGNVTVKKVGKKAYRYDLRSVLELFALLNQFDEVKMKKFQSA